MSNPKKAKKLKIQNERTNLNNKKIKTSSHQYLQSFINKIMHCIANNCLTSVRNKNKNIIYKLIAGSNYLRK